MLKYFRILLIIFSVSCSKSNSENKSQFVFNPENYVCYKSSEKPIIDGELDESCWRNAEWTNDFVDIEGNVKPKPCFSTRVKMLWDEAYLYFGAELEEPHIWSKLKQRDTVIFYDNDFELFIDPNSDSHEYYEFEINALGTVWDLFLTKPYRDGGKAINNWDINGLKTGIGINGTLNNPTDIDTSWTVEVAIPWAVLKECAYKDSPPEEGDQWRVNFSRVQWITEVVNGTYKKKTDRSTGKHLPEHNWVWSPQGVIAMHQPETWGIVQFTHQQAGEAEVNFIEKEEYPAAYLLYNLYQQQNDYFKANGSYQKDLAKFISSIQGTQNYNRPPELRIGIKGFEIYWEGKNDSPDLLINQEGKLIKYH